jgi:hypothetical protein
MGATGNNTPSHPVAGMARSCGQLAGGRQRSLRMYCRNGSLRSSTITPSPSANAAR